MQQRSPNAFTLVEVLLATAIVVVVAALAWSLLSSTSAAVGRQAARALGPQAAARALETIRADLTGLFLPPDDEACALVLRPAGADPFLLSFCTIRATGRTPDLVWTEPQRVEYVLAREENRPAALLRVTHSLSGPVAASTNVVLDRVAQFRLELGDGAAWHAAWPPPEAESTPPRIARVAVQIEEGGDVVDVDYWLPAGHSVTSRIVRSGARETAP